MPRQLLAHLAFLCPSLITLSLATQGSVGNAAGPLPRRPELVLRGGVQPASVAEKPASFAEKPATPSPRNLSTIDVETNATQPAGQSEGLTASQPKRRQAKPRPAFGARDAVAAALGLSAAGAAQWCCSTNLMAAMMAFVPTHVRKPVWCLGSGTLAAALLLLVRITNPSRAVVINSVLSKLVLNRESRSTLPSLAFVFILGIIAAIKALPAYDLKLLWASLSSLAVVVGTAAIKFGKRPSFAELVDWAFDSIASSASSSVSR